jgi:hypothetical protein
MTMVPVGMLDQMGVVAVDVSVDVSASEEGRSVDVMLELGSDMSIMESF